VGNTQTNKNSMMTRINPKARCWWLTPVLLASQEAKIRRNMVGSQPGQIVLETLSQKNPI
jgi:hypothetical protein